MKNGDIWNRLNRGIARNREESGTGSATVTVVLRSKNSTNYTPRSTRAGPVAESWVKKTAKQFNLGPTLRNPGRPKRLKYYLSQYHLPAAGRPSDCPTQGLSPEYRGLKKSQPLPGEGLEAFIRCRR